MHEKQHEQQEDINPTSIGLEPLTRRLDVLIGLLVEWAPGDRVKRSARDQTIRLFTAGLRPIEIAAITGRHASNVNRDLSVARRDGRIPKSVK